MSKSMNKQALYMKIQSAPNVAETMVAADAVLAKDINPNPTNPNSQTRNLIKSYLGNSGTVQVSSYMTIEFTVELAGSGAAGTAPQWGKLLRGCAFDETIVAGTRVDYSPITDSQEFLTIDYYLDGARFVSTDAMGSMVVTLNASGIPELRFSFVGFVPTESDTPNPVNPDFSNWEAPLGVSKANTPTFTLHGVAVKATKLSIDMANDVPYRNYIGNESIEVLDRQPTGSATFEFDSLATANWFQKSRAGTTGALQMIHGITAGNIVQIDSPKLQPSDVSLQDDSNIAMINTSFQLLPDTGNDEIVVSAR